MKAMLDTDTCIYAMSAAAGFQPKLPLRDCAISVVVVGEVEYGVLRSQQVRRNRLALDHWLAAVQVGCATFGGALPSCGQVERLRRAARSLRPHAGETPALPVATRQPTPCHRMSHTRAGA